MPGSPAARVQDAPPDHAEWYGAGAWGSSGADDGALPDDALPADALPADDWDWSAGAPWDVVPGTPPEADVVVVPRPRTAARLTDDDLVAALVSAESIGRRIDALRVALAAEVAERSRRELGPQGLARRRGCRTAVELIQRATGVAGGTASRRVRLGGAVRPGVALTGSPTPPRFPAVAIAWEEGRLGADAAAAVVEGLGPCERVAGTAAVQAAESEVVAGATNVDPEATPPLDADSVRLQTALWRAVLDPDGAAPSPQDVERRGLALGAPRHGLVPLRGLLLPDVAAQLTRYADAWTSPRTAAVPEPAAGTAVAGCAARAEATVPAAPSDPAEPSDPAGLAAPPDPRSRAQVLHDVLANAVTVAARAVDAPSVAGAPPTLVVSVTAADLAAGRGAAWVDETPVDQAVARQVACAGAVERVLRGDDGQVVGLRSDRRCFTPQQRRAIALRDGTCVIPGCHVPSGWCEVHHVVPHATDPDGTHTDNGVLLCWFHHRTLDTSGWEVRIRDGLPQVRAPGWLDGARAWRPVLGRPPTPARVPTPARLPTSTRPPAPERLPASTRPPRGQRRPRVRPQPRSSTDAS